ncbi:MAG: UDP-N-acetylmuramoyl-L-alanyl-D-glutamate--2,6-diaminopimelate ligase, partial [Gammaproteobacteria bacterium]|nr:UDP-N-acetylmuramoyl-L-alanyl-D-glutamate--2,6-diaminopimelate ligase [Gammaproteobacteria bacterium]NIR93952.1 UDP-N-acetylmuramoyl-L-alanyl-D-glutamate--2,6-diaminopimelate ligase [Gammaproteobacteria bacterium]
MMVATVSKSTMHLCRLLEGIATIPSTLNYEISDLTMDSRQVDTGKLFLAVRGQNVNGVDYIDDAIARGAAAVMFDTGTNERAVPPVSWKTLESGRKVPVIAVEGLSKRIGEIADRFYNSPSSRLFVAGITGTNGKTSCSQFVAQVLQQDEICGVIGTLGTGLYGKLQHSGYTTPDVITNHRQLAQMRDQGASNVVMEVSSHALDQGRVDAIHFDCAVFTNLSHEHLDYHGDMGSYAAVKRKLFEVSGLTAAVINSDDDYGRNL